MSRPPIEGAREPVERGMATPADTPAPVATERGMLGEPRPVLEALESAADGAGRRFVVWLLGALLAGAAALWIVTLSVAQATDEEVALPALERAVAALTDLEGLLDQHLEAVQEQADSGAEKLVLPAYVVRDAAVPTASVTNAGGTVDRVLLRDALLSTSARLVYTRGVDAFRQSDEAPERASRLSVSGGVRALLDGLSSDNHGAAVVWLWPVGVVCLALAAALLALGRDFGRFVALGVVLVAAAAPVLLAGVAARFALGFVDGSEATVTALPPGDAVIDEFTAMGRQLAGLPIRNALWLAAAGVAIALPAALLGALFDRSVRRPASGEARG